MKTFLSAMVVLVMVVSAGAQSRIFFANNSNTWVTYCGGTPVPPGNRFSVNLYYSPDAPTAPPESAFIPMGNPVGFLSPGRFNGGIRTTPFTTPAGQPAWFEVRVWETAYGSSYEEALNNPGGFIGLSPPFNIAGVASPTAPPTPITTTGGFTGLDIGTSEQCIPEPSSMGLILFGLAFLGCCWRHKITVHFS